MTKNKIDTKLAQCKAEGKKALITFITAGDGGYDCTEKAVLEMAKNGADLIELGVPFSDPIAEGPVIQCASERALQNGTTLAGIFDLVRRLRKETDVPLLLMMYLNTIFCYGTDRFFATCQECGIDGVIVPDIPFEEKDEIQGDADKYNVHNISLVTPASEDRIQMIASRSNWLPVLCLFQWRNRCPQRVPDEFCTVFREDSQVCKGTVRSRLWHFRSGGSKGNEPVL